MASVAAAQALAPPPTALGASPAVLDSVIDRHVALAVWTRPNPCRLPIEPAMPIDVNVAADIAPPALADLLSAAGYGASLSLLAADIAMLQSVFARLANAEMLRLRLDRITTDACRLFHADYVPLRLLCTYAGPATQWRAAPEGVIQSLKAGDVAIFKGRILQDPPVILHRSPPIAGTGIERMMLALDPLR